VGMVATYSAIRRASSRSFLARAPRARANCRSRLGLNVLLLPQATRFSVGNDEAGWNALSARLSGLPLAAIGLEPSGGYERGVEPVLRHVDSTEALPYHPRVPSLLMRARALATVREWKKTAGAPSSFAALSPRRLRASSRDGGGVVNRPPSPLTMLLSRHTRRRNFIVGALVMVTGGAAAEVGGRRVRVGYLSSHSPTRFHIDLFRTTLRELGWREGDNLDLDFASADGDFDRLSKLANDLAGRNPDAIVALPTVAALAAKATTVTIPIVFTHVSDPIGSGLVTSLAHPGANVTGFTHVNAGLTAKRLSLPKEVLPGLQRVAALWHPVGFDESTQREMLNEVSEASRSLGVTLTMVTVPGAEALSAKFQQAKENGAQAVIILPNPMFLNARDQIAVLERERRLPTIYFAREFVEAGGLISYGADAKEMVRASAGYIDRILKGQSPRDLPVQSATKFELVINLKTAKALGLTIPPTLLACADEVIE
jgi:putative tryptophan/tyrosine transport system substrate-binding protein